MPKKKMLVVVGAGASSEVGLPIGVDLIKKIQPLLDFKLDVFSRLEGGDKFIRSVILVEVNKTSNILANLNEYVAAAQIIRKNIPLIKSIDSFIHDRSDNNLIACLGKLAIVRSILDAERRSMLYFENRSIHSTINYTTIEFTWFNEFQKILTESCNKDELEERFATLSMVIFNYDRCVEHFLFNYIQTHYSISKSKAAELVNSIDIYHPYGQVGYLPWQNKGSNINFGAELGTEDLLSLSKEIRTYTEGTDQESSEIVAIREQVKVSKTILFLGFAFHKRNVELLQPEYAEGSLDRFGISFKCFATAKDESGSNRKEIEDDICKLLQINLRDRQYLHVNNLSCAKLFKEYGRSLSFD